jgi:hypothetical protein
MADDVISIQNTGAPTQNVDNTALLRSDGLLVDRQRVVLKGDVDFQQPPMLELYMLQLIELSRLQLVELKILNHLVQEGFSSNDIDTDSVENMRNDPTFNTVQPR